MYIHTNTIEPLHLKTIEGPKGRFYVTPDNDKYPSITTVLGAKDKSWLNDWRQSLGADRADKETARAANRGTAVHLMIERHLQNHPDPTTGQNFDHVNEYKSVRLALKKVNNILLQEAALYSDVLKVAGRVDCIAEYNGQMSVIDFKTSTNTKSVDMIEDYYLQTTAYSLMCEELYGIQVPNIVIIMCVERGLPMVFKQSVENYIEPLCKRLHDYHTSRRAA